VKLFRWRGLTSKTAFRDRVCGAVRERLSTASVEPTEDLGIAITGLPDRDRLDIWLGRAYDEFRAAPANADEIVARWVRFIESSASSASRAIDAERIVPVVKERHWLDEQRAALPRASPRFSPLIEPYNDELVVVYAEYRDGLHFPDYTDFEPLGSPAELRARALANLRSLIGTPTVTGEEGAYLLGVGGTLDASLLLLDEVTQDERLDLTGDPVIAVSDRGSFWVADAANPWAVFRTAAGVARCFRTEPYPISRQLFRRSSSRYDPLDPALRDDSHPIPDISVIDVHGVKRGGGSDLAIIIATPLRADARSVFRLFRKLDGYLDEINTQEYARQCGPPTPAVTKINVRLHGGSDPVIRELLAGARDWVDKRNASLFVGELGS